MEEPIGIAAPVADAPRSADQWVLVVEDNAELRQLVGLSIEELTGLEVRAAADGMQAVGQLLQGQPALIVTDLMMPHMDGWQLFDLVRRDHPDLPVIAMSAVESRGRAGQAGFDGFLTKPFELEELGAALARWLSVR
jgi:CheY-like chemotaxis protein